MNKNNKLKEKKLYNFDCDTNKNKNKNKKKDKKNKKKINNDIKIKYDDEIIIGVTKFPEKEKENKKIKKQKNKKKKAKLLKENDIETSKIKEKNKKRINFKKENKELKKSKNLYILLVIILIVITINLLLISPIFNIKTISIKGNRKINNDKIISIAELKLNSNIFKINNIEIINKLKENSYIENVEIDRKIPDKIELIITEREPYYMIEYGSGYVYISDKGYILEITDKKVDLPILIGIKTLKNNYIEGNRLDEEDLLKLRTTMKIIKFAKLNKIEDRITKIDISNENNYILYLEKDKKIAYMGNCENIETRMLYLLGILEKEKNKEGKIFIDMNLNNENPYFRENV